MSSVGAWIRNAVRPLRLLAGRFVLSENSFVGAHGCLRTAASFVAWNQVEGDYLEFGVFRGDSMVAADRALQASRRALPRRPDDPPEYRRFLETPPRLFAFDSFEGLPPGAGARHVDYDAGAYSCSEAEFRRNLASQGVDLARVVTVPGFYDQTLNAETKRRIGLQKAALVMIDCDLYESTVPVLEFLTDLVGQGTVLIFHDWFRFQGSPNHGEQRACREWLARNPHLQLIEYWKEGPQAVSFLVNLV